MSDMPSAREHALQDLRRKRAGNLASLMLGLWFIAFVLTGEVELMALALAALFALLAVPSWVGVEARYPIPTLSRELWHYASALALPVAGFGLVYLVWSKGQLEALNVAPVVALGAVVFAVYRWHGLAAALARVRGAGAGMTVWERLWRHYLGYFAGLAAGGTAVLASGAPREWPLSLSLFLGSFLIIKLVIDMTLPQPTLPSRRLSASLFAMTLMSPVWFGLPWGAALTAVSVLFGLSLNLSLEAAIDDSAMILAYVTGASVVVFAALTTAAAVLEMATGEG